MTTFLRSAVALMVAAALLSQATVTSAAPTPEQREELAAAGGLMIQAGSLFKAGKFKESGEAVKAAQAKVEKLATSDDKQLQAQLATLYRRLSNAHALLELEGVKLPELKPLDSFAKPAAKPGDKPGDAPAGDAISFTKQVAPILVTRCGNCHVRQMRGDFSMANYDILLKGPQAGKVIFPSDAAGSVLIEKIESKEMPPNGTVPDAELATLKKWIAEGAKFDGPDRAAQLTSFTGGTTLGAAPMLQVTQATGKETIKFARDVAPVLSSTCTGCHGDRQPRNNFSLTTFERLLRTGDNGPVIVPGKPADSLLIKKLKGTGPGQRMPAMMAPLPDDVIAKIEKWVEEGAKFDGADAKMTLGQVAALYKAQTSTHEELSADRAKLAQANWRLSMADVAADHVETENFFVIGNVGPNELSKIAGEAQAVVPKIATMFKAPSDQPLIKGKMTLYLFSRGYDYGELGRMVEQRDIPPQSKGHFRFTIVDAYGAMIPPKSEEYSLEGLIGQQLAGCYIASLGKGNSPHWFAEGASRVAASRLAGDDERVRAWNDQLSSVIASMSKPDDFLTGKLPQEQSDIASYNFVMFLMKDASRFQKLLNELRAGNDFAPSFAAAYGGSPNQAAEIWVRKPPKPISRRR